MMTQEKMTPGIITFIIKSPKYTLDIKGKKAQSRRFS